MVKAILSDIAGVLLTDGMKKWAEGFGQEFDIDIAILKTIFAGDLSDTYHAGLISSEEFWNQVSTRLNISLPNPTDLESEWASCYDMVPQTKEILLQLKTRMPVYYLSNQTVSRATALEEKFSLSSIFTDGIYSCRVGVVKPHLEIYNLAIDKFKLTAAETVFIDDFESNLLPARQLGIHTILYTTPDQLKADIQSLGCVL